MNKLKNYCGTNDCEKRTRFQRQIRHNYVPVSLRLRMYPLGDINCDKNSTSYGTRINKYTVTNTIVTIIIIIAIIFITIIIVVVVVVVVIIIHSLVVQRLIEFSINRDYDCSV